jgi:multidrug efflux system outer membrane protein
MPLAITPLRKTRVLLTTLVLGCSTLLSSCTLAPHYERPAPPVASNWTDPAPDHAPAPDATAIGWRDFFTDPRLQRLIELALRENRDLRVAALNVQAAEAQYRVQRASLFPTIDVTALQETEKIPDAVAGIVSGGASAGAGAGNTTSGGSGSITERLASVGVGFTSYELDLFGRIRSLTRTALETYLSDEQTRRSSQISLIAEIASAYLTVCADRAILQVTRETLASQIATVDLTRRTVNLGTGTALTLRQAEITVDTARANLAAYTQQLAQDRNALVLLLGAPLPPDAEFADTPEMTLPPALPEGVPSEVLTRRPDVLAAEHQLIGANANIGAARAAFFPSITLTGSLGTESTQLSGLFKPGSQAWSFEPQITLPIFTGGANRANLDLAKIQKNIYIADYEKTIQSAFREVDDALSARATLDAQLAAERALVDAAADAYRLSDMRFRGGIDTFLSVLDAERTLYSAQQGVVTLELSRSQNLATLYKALGGGLLEHSERR